jgi:polyisoprenoid-binding protein YceI
MAQFQLDKMHSEVNFKVKHLMISTVSGLFSEFDSTVETDGDDFTNAKINFTVNTNSISTNNGQRDEHLKSPDFFDSANHPNMTFTSTELKKSDNGHYVLVGDLSIRGHVKSVSLDVNYEGKMVDFYGNEKHIFEVSGVINRKEFGLAWSAVTEAGGIVVSDEVKISANIQYQKI